MSARLTFMIILSVSLSAIAQVMLKFGMRLVNAGAPIGEASVQAELWRALSNPAVLGGFILYGGSAVVWLFVLGHADVSVAYPFVGLGFIVTMVAGYLLLGEVLTVTRIAGTLLVCAGVAMIAASG